MTLGGNTPAMHLRPTISNEALAPAYTAWKCGVPGWKSSLKNILIVMPWKRLMLGITRPPPQYLSEDALGIDFPIRVGFVLVDDLLRPEIDERPAFLVEVKIFPRLDVLVSV
jgi:hypothetical protein